MKEPSTLSFKRVPEHSALRPPFSKRMRPTAFCLLPWIWLLRHATSMWSEGQSSFRRVGTSSVDSRVWATASTVSRNASLAFPEGSEISMPMVSPSSVGDHRVSISPSTK